MLIEPHATPYLPFSSCLQSSKIASTTMPSVTTSSMWKHLLTQLSPAESFPVGALHRSLKLTTALAQPLKTTKIQSANHQQKTWLLHMHAASACQADTHVSSSRRRISTLLSMPRRLSSNFGFLAIYSEPAARYTTKRSKFFTVPTLSRLETQTLC